MSESNALVHEFDLDARVNCIAFSPDGRLLAAGLKDETIALCCIPKTMSAAFLATAAAKPAVFVLPGHTKEVGVGCWGLLYVALTF